MNKKVPINDHLPIGMIRPNGPKDVAHVPPANIRPQQPPSNQPNNGGGKK